MTLNIEKELAVLNQLTTNQLHDRFAEVFGELPRSRHKTWLVKRIIWRLQAREEGDLSERARCRAMELADDANLRVTAPKIPKTTPGAEQRTTSYPILQRADGRLPMPGSVLTRDYKGHKLLVKVCSDGFEYQGEIYKSLTAIAKKITGTHWNGFHFFGLSNNGGSR